MGEEVLRKRKSERERERMWDVGEGEERRNALLVRA